MPARARQHERTAIAVRGEHHGAGPVTSAAAEATSRRRGTHTGRGSRRRTAEAVRGITQTARNLRVAAVGKRTAIAVRGEHHGAGPVPSAAAEATRRRRETHGSRQSAEHGRSSAGYHADGAEPSGRGSRLSTAEAVRGIVQRHVQERHWRAQPTHPRGTYHREATDLRSAARDSSQNDRDDRRDTLSRSLSRRILAKCLGHEMQPRIGRTQLPSMSL